MAKAIIDTMYVGQTAHGAMRVADVLARFERAEEAILYAGSRLVTLDKNNAKRAAAEGHPVQSRAVRAATLAPSAPVAAPTGETRSQRNKRLWAAFTAAGGSNADGGAAWLAFKASQPDSAPASAPAPVVNAPVTPKAKRPASPAQLQARANFAAAAKARRAGVTPAPALDVAAQIAALREENARLAAALVTPKAPPVQTVQTVTATPPVTRQRARAVKLAPVTQENVPVSREVEPPSTSDDAMADWILSQPDPARVGIRDVAAQFPLVSNNRRMAAIKLVREVCGLSPAKV